MVTLGNPGDGSEADARHPSLAPCYCVGDEGEQGAPERGWGGGRGRGRGGGRGGRRGALRVLTACLPCSPRRGDSWDRWRRPPALGASLPAAPPQRRARRHAAAPAPRGALDLHRVRPDLGPGPRDSTLSEPRCPRPWNGHDSSSCPKGLPPARHMAWLAVPHPPPQSQPGRKALHGHRAPATLTTHCTNTEHPLQTSTGGRRGDKHQTPEHRDN